MPDSSSAILQQLQAQRRALLAGDEAAIRALTRRWLQVERTMQARIELLAGEIAKATRLGIIPDEMMVTRLAHYQSLQRQLYAELDKYATAAADIITEQQRRMVQFAANNFEEALLAQGVRATFNRLPVLAFQHMVGHVAGGSPLYNYFLASMQREAIDGMMTKLLEGVALGLGPRETARLMRDGLGIAHKRAILTARTETLRVYRYASLQNYQASSVVLGWKWLASKDTRTCFPAGTQVRTIEGNIPIENVRVGDFVLTGKNRWRKVINTMMRQYEGEISTVRLADGTQLNATNEHPVLLERQGHLHWKPIDDAKVGDCLIAARNSITQTQNHGISDRAIKRRIWQAHDDVSISGETQSLTSVGVRSLVPIDAVNFKGDIVGGKKEVNGVSVNGRFLDVFNSEKFKTTSGISFRLSFPDISTITGRAAELLIGHRRNDTKRLFALNTRFDHRRSATFFGTVSPVMLYTATSESLAATSANNIVEIGSFTSGATVGVAMGNRFFDAELISTGSTYLSNVFGSLVSLVTGARTKFLSFLDFAKAGFKRFAAMLTGYSFALALSEMETISGAVLPASWHIRAMRGRTCKRRITLDTGVNFSHTPIISHVTTRCNTTAVYNLTVDEDHTYFANDILVHNCIACLVMDGSEHDLHEPFDSHVQCRCAPVPIVDRRQLNWQSGEDWFKSQSAAQQQATLGEAKYTAWRGGKLALRDFAHHAHDPVFGGSWQVASMQQAIENAARRHPIMRR